MDSACFIANGRDGGGHLSLLLTEAFQAKNIVTIFCQEYNFPWCLAKEQDSLCLSLERIGRGRADGGICSQATRALRSEPNLPGTWLSEQEKHELLHLCLSFSGGLTVINHRDLGCQAEPVCAVAEQSNPVIPEAPLEGSSQHSPGHQLSLQSYCRLTRTISFLQTM